MGDGHLERLTALDAAFLQMETPTEHMHTAGLFVFEAPAKGEFDFSRFLALVRSRLHLVPRFRQILAFTPLSLANPMWVDDEEFDLSFHVRHAALPRPGTTAQLMEYAGRIVSRQLDREHPLWELYVIEGLGGGRIAILGKTHHAMIDGISGIDIATVMLDFSPDIPDPIPPPEPWHPSPRPSEYDLAWSAARDIVTAPRRAVEAVQRLGQAPQQALLRAARTAQGLVSTLSKAAPAPRSPLNRPHGVWRRFAMQRVRLDDVKRVKTVFGTTVNDVVLAIVADATGRYLRGRGETTRGLTLRAMVPVSVRADEEQLALGNRVTSVFCPLPVDEMDPVERLQTIHGSMSDVKERHDAVGADFLINLTSYAPPTIHGMAARLAARTRLYNFLVTNVPGPQAPLYMMGGRLLGAFPFVPLVPNHLFAVGLTSLDGWMNFGFTGDYDELQDLESVTGHLVAALKELLEHAGAADTFHELAHKPTATGRSKNGSKERARATGA